MEVAALFPAENAEVAPLSTEAEVDVVLARPVVIWTALEFSVTEEDFVAEDTVLGVKTCTGGVLTLVATTAIVSRLTLKLEWVARVTGAEDITVVDRAGCVSTCVTELLIGSDPGACVVVSATAVDTELFVLVMPVVSGLAIEKVDCVADST